MTLCAGGQRLGKRVGEYVYLVSAREPTRQFDDVAAVPAGPLVVVRDQADAHVGTIGWDVRRLEKSASNPSTCVSSVYRDVRR